MNTNQASGDCPDENHVQRHLGDAILGGMDGCVTTFAVVAGAAGAQLPAAIVIIMGVANLFADAFSMAAGNFLATQSEHDRVTRAKQLIPVTDPPADQTCETCPQNQFTPP